MNGPAVVRPIATLIVEDEPIAARAHHLHVSKVPGFTVVGVVGTGRDAARVLAGGGVDLVLLDLHLPDVSGLELFRRIRAAGSIVDVMVVSSARDTDTLRTAVAQGAVQYLIKPFAFATLREKLLAFRLFRDQVAGGGAVEQSDIDRALAALRSAPGAHLPKGMTRQTMEMIGAALVARGDASARELGEDLNISRITARRYLSHLVEIGMAKRGHRYGQVGRPETRYRMLPPS